MGHHKLPCRQCDHPAHYRLVVGSPRTPQLLPAVDRHLHPGVRRMWYGHQPRPVDRISCLPGPGRRWSSAFQSGRAAGRLSGREARHCDDAVRPGGPFGAGRRSDPRRLDHRQLFVAVGVLYQRPGWPRSVRSLLCAAPGSGLSRKGARGVEEAAVAFRRNRSVTPGDRHGLLGSGAQQGTGVGLARRSILARADAGDFFRFWSDGADLLGVAPPQPRGQFPPPAGTKFRCMLRHHLLRVRSPLRRQHVIACPASIPVRL